MTALRMISSDNPVNYPFLHIIALLRYFWNITDLSQFRLSLCPPNANWTFLALNISPKFNLNLVPQIAPQIYAPVNTASLK